MNGGLVPFILIGFSVGLMLAFASNRVAGLALAALAGAASLTFLATRNMPQDLVFAGLWGSMIAVAGTTFLRIGRWPIVFITLSIIAGFWLGACAAVTSEFPDLIWGTVAAFICFPARWLADHRFDIVIKVVASWMIAIASLSMFVSLMPTPGYKPDHME